MITALALGKIMPLAKLRAQVFAPFFEKYCTEFNINTPQRIAAFLGQIAVESGELRYTKELGTSQYLSKYDTGNLAKRLGNTPEADGDGQKYRGRALIQITGLINYLACGKALGVDLIEHPELLEQPDLATRAACWYWQSRGLNQLADEGDSAYPNITRRVNGGLNHHLERVQYYERAKREFGI